MSAQKPLILISNDDGIFARGLQTLVSRLSELGEIMVVAPDSERSAASHAFSLNRPLRVKEVEPGHFAVDGTPADCVYLATLHLAKRTPALVVSGINHGFNLGSDFFYSGTVAAAVEGTIRGIPSFAISLERGPKSGFEVAADFAHGLAKSMIADGLPNSTVLSVNVPNRGPIQGVAWTRQGQRVYRDQVEERNDIRGRKYYWIGGPEILIEDAPDSDCAQVKANQISITPLKLDLSCETLLADPPAWTFDGFEVRSGAKK